MIEVEFVVITGETLRGTRILRGTVHFFFQMSSGGGGGNPIISNLGETPSWLISSTLLFPNELFSEQKRTRMKCITLGLIHHTI